MATSYVKQNKPCLEACLRCLVKTLESFEVGIIWDKQSMIVVVSGVLRIVPSLLKLVLNLTCLDVWTMSIFPSPGPAGLVSPLVVRHG